MADLQATALDQALKQRLHGGSVRGGGDDLQAMALDQAPALSATTSSHRTPLPPQPLPPLPVPLSPLSLSLLPPYPPAPSATPSSLRTHLHPLPPPPIPTCTLGCTPDLLSSASSACCRTSSPQTAASLDAHWLSWADTEGGKLRAGPPALLLLLLLRAARMSSAAAPTTRKVTWCGRSRAESRP